MFLSEMKSDAVKIVFALVTLTFGAALEEFLPKPVGIGFPLILSSVIYLSVKFNVFAALAFAVCAGLVEENISALPPATCVGFFTAAAFFSRFINSKWMTAILAYPVCQLWLWLWIPTLGHDVLLRIFAAVPVGVLTMAVVFFVMRFVEKAGAVNAE
jgi:hypothetical protein